MDLRRTAALLVLLVGLSVTPPWSADASCAGPQVIRPTETVDRGATLTIGGTAFVDGCDDVGGRSEGIGCAPDREIEGEVVEPLRDVELRLRQGSREWSLAVADAHDASDDQLGRIEWKIVVPDGVRPGKAFLETERTGPLRIDIARPR